MSTPKFITAAAAATALVASIGLAYAQTTSDPATSTTPNAVQSGPSTPSTMSPGTSAPPMATDSSTAPASDAALTERQAQADRN